MYNKNKQSHFNFGKQPSINNDSSILIKHESCLFVRVFRSHQKSQGHEILALGLIGAN